MKCIVCGKPTAIDSRLLCARHYGEVMIPDTIKKGGK